MIEITERWGLAKKGSWEFSNQEIKIPNIFFLEGEYFDVPDRAEITISDEPSSRFSVMRSFFEDQSAAFPKTFAYPESIGNGLVEIKGGEEKIQVLFDQEPDPDAELFVIGNAPELFQRSRTLYERIIELRKKIDHHKLIYLPGIARVNNLALLTYLGVDLFDSSLVELMSSDGIESSNWLTFEGSPESNTRRLMEELNLVRKAIGSGRIRDLIESRVRTEPWMVEVLRSADEDYELFSRGVPVTGNTLYATTRESQTRPDIKRFARRIKDRYEPPENREILLLLPCSAKKPYFYSRSHSRIREATQQTDWTSLQELMLTSPLGAVPRELELFYPAQQYDIPVTGRWIKEEIEMIINQLRVVIEKKDYKQVISHLPEEMDFVQKEIDCIDTTKGDHPTSPDALDRLREVLKDEAGEERGNVKRYLKENLGSFARFQFGPEGAELLEGAEVRGRYPRYRIIEEEKQRGMLVPERGLISLTLEGAKILKEKGIYQAQIDDFYPEGSVFAVGVKEASDEIRPEDEVIVLHEEELRGVGPAVMSGEEMKQAEKGEAIRLRHYP